MTTTPGSEAPEDMQEAVALLHADGYTADFNIARNRVPCPVCGADHEPAALIVDRFYRFEGDSDPADESIVFGVSCPVCGTKGVLVSPYGPDADPEVLQQLSLMTRRD